MLYGATVNVRGTTQKITKPDPLLMGTTVMQGIVSLQNWFLFLLLDQYINFISLILVAKPNGNLKENVILVNDTQFNAMA